MLFFQRNLNLINKRRTLRALYAQTQAYPYPALLDPNFVRTGGQLVTTGAYTAIAGAQAAIYPGSVAIKQVGENVTLATADTANIRPFGLFNDFVGGPLDQLGSGTGSQSENNRVGVWRGVGGVFEILAPAFGTVTVDSTEGGAAGAEDAADETYLVPNGSGVVASVVGPYNPGAGSHAYVGRALAVLSANAIVVELLV